MYNEKMETVRIEIVEKMNEDKRKNHSMLKLFCKFVGAFFKNLFKLFAITFTGLWCFIRYAFYNFMVWCDNQENEEVRKS